jgi:hypothetical protein
MLQYCSINRVQREKPLMLPASRADIGLNESRELRQDFARSARQLD